MVQFLQRYGGYTRGGGVGYPGINEGVRVGVGSFTEKNIKKLRKKGGRREGKSDRVRNFDFEEMRGVVEIVGK